MKHGTLSSYSHGCRCDRCRDTGRAHYRAYQRDYKAKHCAEHVDEYVERTVQSVAWFDERIEISNFTATDRLTDFDLAHMQYQADRPRQYAAGRRCCHDGCKTILSRYNPGTTCDPHKPAPDFMVYLGRRFRVCDTCSRLDFERAFRRLTPDERATTCLRCEAKQKRASDRAAKMKIARAKATAGAVRGCLRMVRCSKCKALKPANSKHFTIRLDGRRSSTCLVCERERSNDRYYIRTYGMTRAEYRGNS